jgi:uncharacterized protein
MASGLLALLDDVTVLLDDVAAMSKIATKKTAGILGDDLAVNAEKASGFASARELSVLWAIFKGSFLNKIIILPIAFLLSAFFPPAILVILILGGVFLAYEGAEKIFEYFFHKKQNSNTEIYNVLTHEEIISLEKQKIKSAIITDFILSVEIVIIAIGTVLEKPISIQIAVVSIVALIATIGVYGIVALIVRMDESGLKLMEMNQSEKSLPHQIGKLLVKALPFVIKSLAFLGTIALLLVAGGIFSHNIHFFHNILPQLPNVLKEFILGILVGFITLGVVTVVKKILGK